MSDSKVDTTKPHFLGNKEDPHSFLVLPGKGKNGGDLEIHRNDPRYAKELGRNMPKTIDHESTEKINDIDSVAGDEDMTAHERANKIDEMSGQLQEHLETRIDNWVAIFDKHLSGAFGDDAGIVDDAPVKAAIEETKKTIEDLLQGETSAMELAYSMARGDEEHDYEELSNALSHASQEIESALDNLADVMTNHSEAVNDAIDARQEKWESDAGDVATELNDDYGDNGEEATERAKDLNEGLAEEDNQYRVAWDEDAELWAYEYEEDLEDYPGKKKSAKASRRKVVRHV